MRALSRQNLPRRASARPLEELIRHHQGAVRGFLFFLGCPAHQVDDLCQEVFLVVLSRDFEDRHPTQTAAFLRRVARNLFLKAMRNLEREPNSLEIQGLENAWVTYQGDDQGGRYLDALGECLRTLRPRATDVLQLRYRDKETPAAIGRRVGLSESGVKSILVRTKKSLRSCIERRLSR